MSSFDKAAEGMQSMGWLESYGYYMDRSPLLVCILTMLVLNTIGDTLAQKIGGKPWNSTKCFRMVSWSFISAPMLLGWYTVLNYTIPGTSVMETIIKVTLDQTLWATLANSVFFTYMNLGSGQVLEVAVLNAKKQLRPCMLANWKVWPMVQLVNLGMVPKLYQFLVVNCVSIPWAAYLSTLASSSTGVTSHPKDQDSDVEIEEMALLDE